MTMNANCSLTGAKARCKRVSLAIRLGRVRDASTIPWWWLGSTKRLAWWLLRRIMRCREGGGLSVSRAGSDSAGVTAG